MNKVAEFIAFDFEKNKEKMSIKLQFEKWNVDDTYRDYTGEHKYTYHDNNIRSIMVSWENRDLKKEEIEYINNWLKKLLDLAEKKEFYVGRSDKKAIKIILDREKKYKEFIKRFNKLVK